MTPVSCSIPCPSTSRACGILPPFVTVNVTVPAAIVPAESSAFHSVSVALTAAGFSGRCARRLSKSLATFRTGTSCAYDILVFLQRECDSSFLAARDSTRRASIPAGINSSAVRSSPVGLTRHREDLLESSALARFEAVVLPHLDAAYTLARYLMRNAQDAEDVVQDACLRALKYFEGFRGEEATSARAWLLTIVRNTAHSWRKRHRPDALAVEFDETEHSDAVVHDPEAKETLGRALDRLAPEFREVIVLRELQGLSYKEISDVTGVPVGTVMSRLSRGRARLQEALREEEVR